MRASRLYIIIKNNYYNRELGLRLEFLLFSSFSFLQFLLLQFLLFRIFFFLDFLLFGFSSFCNLMNPLVPYNNSEFRYYIDLPVDYSITILILHSFYIYYILLLYFSNKMIHWHIYTYSYIV
jgi:hypothetical protein